MSLNQQRAIVGGGLAGLSLADALVEEGAEPSRIIVFDEGDPRRGSSTPATILHPFPGRSIRLSRGQGESFVSSWSILKHWRERFGDSDWWTPSTMVRPVADDDRGQKLRKSWYDLCDGFPDLIEGREMEPDEVNRRFAGLDFSCPALVYRPAATVYIPRLVAHLRDYLEDRGVSFVDRPVRAIERLSRGWQIPSPDGVFWRGEEVILAMGASLVEVFPELDLRRRAGGVAVLDPRGAPLGATVNARKHLFPRPDGTWGLGSTYFDPRRWDERRDEETIDALRAGVIDLVPAVADAELLKIWRGERGIFGSDHLPLVGPVPGLQGLHSFAAFGSRGLLWVPAAARSMARFFAGKDRALSSHFDSRRMSEDKWRPGEGFLIG